MSHNPCHHDVITLGYVCRLMVRTAGVTISETVYSALEQVTGEPGSRVDPNLPLFEYHLLDSLRTIELLVTLSERIGIDLAPSEVDREVWATPARIVAFLEARVTR